MNSLQELINSSNTIVVVQADNPDGDSLASALALEEVLSSQGKSVHMYCGVEIPGYLRYMDGWDRVIHDLPRSFDLGIVVDTSALSLLEVLDKSGQVAWLKSKPLIIIDHHATNPTIDFARCTYIKDAVSTTELIYDIAVSNDWNISKEAAELLAIGILTDSLGLTSQATTAKSIRVLSQLVELGASLAGIDNKRKLFNKKSKEILAYKGKLLQRVRFSEDGQVAIIDIPWKEIEEYSHQYNPSILVLDEMRQVEGVALAVAFKTYPDGRITAKIRANYGYTVADKLAEEFGGGGHPYASGFRVTDGTSLPELQQKFIKVARGLLE